MTTLARIFNLSVLSILSSSAVAYAQPADGITSKTVAPISNAFEVAVGGGYMQSVGDIGDGMRTVQDLSRSGGGAQLEIGYRLMPNLTLGVYGTLSGYDVGPKVAATTDLVIAASAGAKADWHFRPSSALDPWVSGGAGWRGMWLGNDNATEMKLQGIDVARVQTGLDIRLTPSIAVSPYIGATASVYVARGTGMSSEYHEINDSGLNWTFTGGALARFDMFGKRGR